MKLVQPARLLIIQLRRIGDVLLSTPVIRAVKANFPEAHLTFLTEFESKSLLENNPHVDQLIIWDSGRYSNPTYIYANLKDLKEKKFDTVIDLHGSTRTALASYLSGAKQRLGFGYRGRSLFYNIQVPVDDTPKYGSAFKLDILKPFEIYAADYMPELFVSSQAISWQKKFFLQNRIDQAELKIALSPVSRRPYKRWPIEKFAQLCGWLVEEYSAKMMILWGPGEKEIAERVAELSRASVIISEKTDSLQEAAALLKACDLFIGNDNGIKHIAAAAGIPTFTIYGPSDPISWTLPDAANHRYVKGNCTCKGSQKGRCDGPKCLQSLSVEQTKNLLKPFLAEIISRRSSLKLAQA